MVKDKIAKIIQKHRSFPFSFNWALKRAIGVSEKQLFRQWRTEVLSRYQSLTNKNKSFVSIGEKFPIQLQATYSIRWSPDATKVAAVGVEEFDEEVTRLYVVDIQSQKRRQLASPYINAFFPGLQIQNISFIQNRE